MFCSDARSDYNFGFTKNSKTIDSEEQREASYSALIAWGQPTPPPLHLRGLLLVKARQQPTAQRPLMTVTPPASTWLPGPASSEENGSPATPGCLLGMETWDAQFAETQILFFFLKRSLARTYQKCGLTSTVNIMGFWTNSKGS